jgi:hypothetical protein
MKNAVRFAGPALVTNSAATKYTVSSGEKIVLKYIHVSNTSAGAVTFTMSIGSDAAGTRIYDAYNIAAGAVLDAWCHYPLVAGEIIQALAGTTNILTLTLAGDLYTLGG